MALFHHISASQQTVVPALALGHIGGMEPVILMLLVTPLLLLLHVSCAQRKTRLLISRRNYRVNKLQKASIVTKCDIVVAF